MSSPAIQNRIVFEPKYEEQCTAFVDFLGFADVSKELDSERRERVLQLLQGLASLRSEFRAAIKERNEAGKTFSIRPTISTFSDHIVISYSLRWLASEFENEWVVASIILNQFSNLLSAIAAAALRIGLLIRGGITIGKLYHANGVVFGEAMVEAYQLESRTAVYPRVALSTNITQRKGWTTPTIPHAVKDHDGIYYVDYLADILWRSAMPGENYDGNIKSWFTVVVPIIDRNLKDLEAKGKLNELAKWTWFVKKFRAGLETRQAWLDARGISIKAISW